MRDTKALIVINGVAESLVVLVIESLANELIVYTVLIESIGVLLDDRLS